MQASHPSTRRALAPGRQKAGPAGARAAVRPQARKAAPKRPAKAPRAATDPVALEVFSNALLSVAEEMGALLIRTAYSINIKERQDASTAIFDAQGRLVAQAEHIPMHLGALLSIISNIQKRYPQDEMRPGDAFLANDAYHGGGTHLADVTVASPVFFEGQMIGYVANMGHWPDVGGMMPGAASSEGCTEIYQEGLRIPPMRIMRKGKLQEDLFSFILLNMRFSEDRPADLRAQVAANQVGEKRLQELARKYGVSGYAALIEGVLDYNERTIRSRIRELPEGSWSFEDQLDNDGHEPGPVPLKVLLTVRHHPQPHMIFDFAGSSQQRTGGVNVVYEALFATVAFALKATLDPDLWSNAAFERVIRITAPLGSIVNPRPPAPVGGRGTTCQRLADMLLGAIGKVAPDRVTACGHGTTSISLNGHDPARNKRFICIDGIGGGMGGREGHDGMDAVQINTNNIPSLSAEILEGEYPMRIERYELVPDSGGAGQFRGGLGTRKDFRMLGNTNFLAHSDRHDFAPWAMGGAQEGALGHHYLDPETPGQQTLPSKGGPFVVGTGHVLRCQSPGAGGYGDPAQRDVERLAADLADGKVTEAQTRRMYPASLVETALRRAREL